MVHLKDIICGLLLCNKIFYVCCVLYILNIYYVVDNCIQY